MGCVSQWFVHGERSPDREPVWSGEKRASSRGARRGAPLLPKSGHEEEEEEEDGGSASQVSW